VTRTRGSPAHYGGAPIEVLLATTRRRRPKQNRRPIDRLVLLAAGAYTPLRRMAGPKLFIMSRNDVIGDNQPRLPAIRAQYERATGPKEFVAFEGSAHAQAIFATSEGDRLMREILRFVSAP